MYDTKTLIFFCEILTKRELQCSFCVICYVKNTRESFLFHPPPFPLLQQCNVVFLGRAVQREKEQRNLLRKRVCVFDKPRAHALFVQRVLVYVHLRECRITRELHFSRPLYLIPDVFTLYVDKKREEELSVFDIFYMHVL